MAKQGGGGGIRTHEPLAGRGLASPWNKPLSDASRKELYQTCLGYAIIEAVSGKMENNPAVPQEEEKTIYSWTAPVRPFKRRNKEFFTTVLAIAFLISLILFFLEGALPVAVVISVVFLVYVLSTVPPETVEHKITNRGIYFAGRMKSWDELARFWLTRRFDSDLLIVESIGLPGRIEMVVDGADRETIRKELDNYLTHEEAEPNFLDKAASWLSSKVPLEGN